MAALTAFTLTLGCPNTEQGFCGDGLCDLPKAKVRPPAPWTAWPRAVATAHAHQATASHARTARTTAADAARSAVTASVRAARTAPRAQATAGCARRHAARRTARAVARATHASAGAATTACGEGGGVCLDCGPGSLCEASACVVDPASRWNLLIDGYEVAATSYTGAAWDTIGGSPDPVVSALAPTPSTSLGSVNGPDDGYMSTFSPARMLASNVRADTLTTYLEMRITDEDATSYERIGGCNVTGSVPLAFGGSTITTMCPLDRPTMNSGFTLRWHLERF